MRDCACIDEAAHYRRVSRGSMIVLHAEGFCSEERGGELAQFRLQLAFALLGIGRRTDSRLYASPSPRSEPHSAGGHPSFSPIPPAENIVRKRRRSREPSTGCGGIAVQRLGDLVSLQAHRLPQARVAAGAGRCAAAGDHRAGTAADRRNRNRTRPDRHQRWCAGPAPYPIGLECEGNRK